METPGSWENNSWQAVSGPEAILIGAVQNPALRPLQGKTLADVAKQKRVDPVDAVLDLLIEDSAQTSVAVFGMAEPDVALALKQPWVSVNNDSEGTAPEGLLG
jgi:N-acyl-D-amino-acid deacylase